MLLTALTADTPVHQKTSAWIRKDRLKHRFLAGQGFAPRPCPDSQDDCPPQPAASLDKVDPNMASLRPTLSDLARETGVSSATVDRVINNRQGVHPRTRELVLTTAKRLGYLPEVKAPLAAEERQKSLRFSFLLPAGNNAFIGALRQQIKVQADDRPDLVVQIDMIEGFNPESLSRHLDRVPAGLDGLGLVALDHPLVREGLRRLAQREVKVVTLASDVLNVPRVAYVGIDNRQAGRLAG